MDYNTKIASLTMLNIEAIVKAAQEASKYATHGSTCRGFLGYSVNEAGDRCQYKDIPEKESFLWWQAFDESQCSCGLHALRQMLWDRKLSETYCKKELKRIEGHGATKHENANIEALQTEVDMLRNEVVSIKEENEQIKAESAKLMRKLAAIQSAATV